MEKRVRSTKGGVSKAAGIVRRRFYCTQASATARFAPGKEGELLMVHLTVEVGDAQYDFHGAAVLGTAVQRGEVVTDVELEGRTTQGLQILTTLRDVDPTWWMVRMAFRNALGWHGMGTYSVVDMPVDLKEGMTCGWQVPGKLLIVRREEGDQDGR